MICTDQRAINPPQLATHANRPAFPGCSFQFGCTSTRLLPKLGGAGTRAYVLILPDNPICAIVRKITHVRFGEGAP